MLSNVRLIVLVTKDNRGGQRYRAPFEIAVLFTNAQKSQSYNYQEACKPAAKIMIKTVHGERAKRTIGRTALSDNTVGGYTTSRTHKVEKQSVHTQASGYLALSEPKLSREGL